MAPLFNLGGQLIALSFFVFIIEMSATIKKLQTDNNTLLKENDRLAEEIQLLEMKIKK